MNRHCTSSHTLRSLALGAALGFSLGAGVEVWWEPAH